MQEKVAKCEICGKEFTYICSTNSKGNKHTCSKGCQIKYAHQKSAASYKDKKRVCKICGKEFIPKNNTQSICNREHKFNCVICGKEFVIPRKQLTEEKLRQTCSDACKRKLMSKHNNGSSQEAIEKRKATCLERYGVEHIRNNIKPLLQINKDSEGYIYIESVGGLVSLDKISKRLIDLFKNYKIPYLQNYIHKGKKFEFYLPDYKILINAKDEKAIKQLVDILKEIDSNIFDYDSYMFKWCRSIDFPYPSYTDNRMEDDWSHLCQYENSNYVNQCRLGESVILNFHHSLYNCKVHGYTSPLEAWNDDVKLKKVIANRFIYANDVDPSKILRGFNVSKICPRVSVFNPVLAKYLVKKYLEEFNEVFDPFSGFSGRLLGVASTSRKYIGQDLNAQAVDESNKIIEYLNLKNTGIIQKDIFESSGEYECLLTCPPYSQKEIYAKETVFRSCDEWIEECLKRFKCKKYVFVVDSTEKFKEYVREELKSTSHFNNVRETIVVISK